MGGYEAEEKVKNFMTQETKQFCRECNNMLYPKEDKQEKVLYLACRNCEHFEEAVSPVVYSMQYNRHTTNKIVGVSSKDLVCDPTLKRVKGKSCTRCKDTTYAYFQPKNLQDDAPLISNYICCTCYKIHTSLDNVV